MQFKFAQFEVMYSKDEGWKNVDGNTILNRLSDCYNWVSPVIFDLFQGKEISTQDAVFRIKKIAGPKARH